jgi:hypothetical protein
MRKYFSGCVLNVKFHKPASEKKIYRVVTLSYPCVYVRRGACSMSPGNKNCAAAAAANYNNGNSQQLSDNGRMQPN